MVTRPVSGGRSPPLPAGVLVIVAAEAAPRLALAVTLVALGRHHGAAVLGGVSAAMVAAFLVCAALELGAASGALQLLGQGRRPGPSVSAALCIKGCSLLVVALASVFAAPVLPHLAWAGLWLGALQSTELFLWTLSSAFGTIRAAAAFQVASAMFLAAVAAPAPTTARLSVALLGCSVIQAVWTWRLGRLAGWSRPSPADVSRTASASVPYAMAAVAHAVAAKADVLLVAGLAGRAAAGLYDVALKIVSFGLLPAVAASRATLPLLFRATSASRRIAERAASAQALVLGSAGLAAVIVLRLAADPVRRLLPEGGPDAAGVLALLPLLLVARGFAVSWSDVITANGRQPVRLRLQLGWAALSLVCSGALIPGFGVAGAAAGTILADSLAGAAAVVIGARSAGASAARELARFGGLLSIGAMVALAPHGPSLWVGSAAGAVVALASLRAAAPAARDLLTVGYVPAAAPLTGPAAAAGSRP